MIPLLWVGGPVFGGCVSRSGQSSAFWLRAERSNISFDAYPYLEKDDAMAALP